MAKVEFDLSSLEAWAENVAKALESEVDAFLLEAAEYVGGEFVTAVQKETPEGEYGEFVEFTTKDGKHVKFDNPLFGKEGGELRAAWALKTIERVSDGVEAIVHNPTPYASYVEYGHIKRNTKGGPSKGFKEGKHMMQETEELMREKIPALVEEKYNKFLKKVLE